MAIYLNSETHKNNIREARIKAMEANIKNKQNRIKEYNKSPNLCFKCSKSIDYEKRTNKFCSRSCSASHNNIGREQTQNTKNKISKSLATYNRVYANNRIHTNKGQLKSYCVIHLNVCIICDKMFYVSSELKERKTCSYECSMIAKSRNSLKTKITKYYNKYQDKIVYLQSTWELNIAIWLDENNIEWIRPSCISWIDSMGTKRKYYADFYLKQYNIYLDPKNAFAAKKEKEKIDAIKNMVYLIVGDVDYIKNCVGQLI